MRKPFLEITTGASAQWAEGLERVSPKPGRVNRLVMQPLADGAKIPKRLPRTIDDIRCWFWSHVVKQSNGCWIWKGPTQVYGVCRVDGKKRRAHRIAYLLAYGYLPVDKLVCHHCDNPPCVNPAHLFLGDDKANHRDAVNKGRKVDCHGIDSFNCKFTEQQVLKIRSRYDAGEGCKKIARELGVSHGTISSIGLRNSWKHL